MQLILLRWHTPPDERRDLETPSPALGQTIATAIHQAVTDPYFEPMERLALFLVGNPDEDEITLDMLTKWATDMEFPTSFVWDAATGEIQIDHPTSPWVLEEVIDRVKEYLAQESRGARLPISIIRVEGKRYWLSFLPIPQLAYDPNQVAGVVFSIDAYLSEHVPRLIEGITNRPRFPLVPFEATGRAIKGEKDGHIAFRILKEDGEVYLQRGRTFDSGKKIYAESDWYDNPIVCLQEGWDLEVFSSNDLPVRGAMLNRNKVYVILIITLVISTMVYWWGSGPKHKQERESNA